MGSGVSLSKTQVDAIIERQLIQDAFDEYVQSGNTYVDGYVVEDFSIEEKYWKDIRKINYIIYRRHKRDS